MDYDPHKYRDLFDPVNPDSHDIHEELAVGGGHSVHWICEVCGMLGETCWEHLDPVMILIEDMQKLHAHCAPECRGKFTSLRLVDHQDG